MHQQLLMFAGRWLSRRRWGDWSNSADGSLRPFRLLRRFMILSFVAVVAISVVFGATLSHFLAREILHRDALLTGQFVSSIVAVQNQEARLGRKITLAQLLDERANLSRLGIDPNEAATLRRQFYDHIRLLPDVLLANVYALDRKIIWATNPMLIGTFTKDNDELEKAFVTRAMVATNYLDQDGHNEKKHKNEQAFTVDPKKFFVESYMPLLNGDSEVVAVVEIYKEPESLLDAVERCRQLVWACTALGMTFLYLALYWIIRRADKTLENQQRCLLESEALCVIGEMSASVVHGIRNPLASIRTSAELALDGDLESVRKNANDIVSQVDRLGHWIRDVLVFSRPVAGASEAIDVQTLIAACLPIFSDQLGKKGISWTFVPHAGKVPRVYGNRTLATQALSSVIFNAIEAMPGGGSLRLELRAAERERQVSVIVSDTGPGMSPAQMNLVFKPFYTTKRNGFGLGMVLVKRIMERFGGSIRLSSVEGEGTCVSLIFSAR